MDERGPLVEWRPLSLWKPPSEWKTVTGGDAADLFATAAAGVVLHVGPGVGLGVEQDGFQHLAAQSTAFTRLLASGRLRIPRRVERGSDLVKQRLLLR